MSENKNINPDNSDTVIVRTGDVARRLSEEKTVLDTRPENSRSLFDDPELEAIIRETEGYDLEPEDNTYDDEPMTSVRNQMRSALRASRVKSLSAKRKRSSFS